MLELSSCTLLRQKRKTKNPMSNIRMWRSKELVACPVTFLNHNYALFQTAFFSFFKCSSHDLNREIISLYSKIYDLWCTNMMHECWCTSCTSRFSHERAFILFLLKLFLLFCIKVLKLTCEVTEWGENAPVNLFLQEPLLSHCLECSEQRQPPFVSCVVSSKERGIGARTKQLLSLTSCPALM